MAWSSSTIRTVLVARAVVVIIGSPQETSNDVPPLPLGLVESVVGALDQVGDAPGIVRKAGHAEARRQRPVLERIALDDRAHAFRVHDRRRLGRAREEGDEFVAAVPGHDSVAPGLARQELDDLLEDLVAGAVAPAIGDGLEP